MTGERSKYRGFVLGSVPDVDIALALGVAVDTVSRARRRRGIPRYEIPWASLDALGRAPDAQLARELGVSEDLVASHRRRLGR